ncbi:MAG: hypothetical protein ACREDS_05525, partial [Limisphaerales bacterium]
MNEQAQPQLERERLLKIFEFLKAYTELRYPPIRDVGQQLRALWLKNLPEHSSLEIFQGNGKAEDESEDSDIVFRITRPTITNCPSPPAAIADWLVFGWQDINGNVEVHPSRNVPIKDGGARIERFEEDSQRPALLRRWQHSR